MSTLTMSEAPVTRITGLGLRRVPSLLQLYVGPLLATDDRPAAGAVQRG